MAFTNFDDPSKYFQTATYSGTNTASNAITNDGNSSMQPDFVWIKQRNSNNPHVLQDSSRGFSGSSVNVLQSNSTAAETTNGAFESFDSNGFTVGGTNPTSGAYNGSGSNYVAWQWKANGGTTSTNTDGDINSTVQVNQTAGFSIVQYQPSDTTSRNIGHGLGVRPDMIIIRNRTRIENWRVWIYAPYKAGTGGIILDSDGTYNQSTSTVVNTVNSTTFNVGSDFSVNGNYPYVAYCFKSIPGYSRVGTYGGNASYGGADGNKVYTGFKPRFVLIKNLEIQEPWVIFDTKRNPHNARDLKLTPNTADGENDNAATGGVGFNDIDIYSNGFKPRTNNGATNGNNYTLAYYAVAETPYITTGGIPTTAV